MAKGKDKRPAVAVEPNPKKHPRALREPESSKTPRIGPMVRGGPLVWRFSSADRGGDFAWSGLDDPVAYKRVMERLHAFETMEERDIVQAGCHSVAISKCCKQAQDRLQAIKLDDLDELFSFRITGAERVWCRMRDSMMLVLWWDSDHQVCPSQKKHT